MRRLTPPQGERGRLRPVRPGLWVTADEHPFGGGASTVGFLLQRPDGNAFVYSSADVDEYFDHLDELGRVEVILLNHRDEAGGQVRRLGERFGARVHAHQAEVPACEARGTGPIVPLHADRTKIGSDLTAIHTPGHTPGVVTYIWANQRDSDAIVLFTGDTLSMGSLSRITVPLQFYPYEGNAADLLSTFETLRDEESDLLAPGLSSEAYQVLEWSAADRQELLGPPISELRAMVDRSG